MSTEIDTLTERIQSATEITTEIVDAINELAQRQADTDLAAACDLSVSAIGHAAAIGYPAGESVALISAGDCATKRRDYSEALSFYIRALEIKQSLDDRSGIASVHSKIGNTKLRTGDYPSALEHYNQAIEILKGSDDELAVATLYANSGIIHGLQGNYSLALRSHLQALKTYEPLNDLPRMASAYTNIGLIYTDQKNFDEALKMFQRALEIRQDTSDVMAVSDTLVNIGIVYQDQLKYDNALEAHKKALTLRENLGDSAKIAYSLSNLGNIYKAIGEGILALDYYTRSLFLLEKVNDKRGLVQSYINLGELYFELKENAEAHRYLRLGMVLATEVGLKNQLREAHRFRSMLYAQEGAYEEAYMHQKVFAKLDREISNSEISVQMAQMSLRHEMEQRERAAEIEKVKNYELQKANDLLAVYIHKLEMSNNELKQFAHVASHDLREPLRMISSYLGLLEQGLADRADERQKQFFWFAIDGAKRMENLIYDLLRLAKVDADPKIEKISLASVVEEIKANLEVLLREKNGCIMADDLPEIMADKTQMLQLFQNIIGNGIKYNDSGQPAITIKYENAGPEIILSVADNGIGIPQEYREKAFQIFQRLPTVKKYDGSGIGLAICKKIVEGMNGNISIGENPAGGTVFKISLPTKHIISTLRTD